MTETSSKSDDLSFHLAWVSVLLVIVGFFMAGLFLSVLAMIIGAIAGARGRVLGWIGLGLGFLEFIGTLLVIVIALSAE